MIAITTINSTKVNPAALRGRDVRVMIHSLNKAARDARASVSMHSSAGNMQR
jgi:hypothetical protein